MTRWVSLDQLVEPIEDDCTLAVGGLLLYRRPVAAVRALLARSGPPRGLTLMAFTAGYACDLLVGAGCVRAVRTAYFGLDAFGLAPRFTASAGDGTLAVVDETETSLALGLRAAAQGVGSLNAVAWTGTDLLKLRPDVQTVTEPYTGRTLTAFPALRPDVTLIHALEADADGNVSINANRAVDELLVYASHTVLVTVERRVDTLTRAPGHATIPSPGVTAVALVPGGARPTSCDPLYTLDGGALLRYVEAAASPDGFEAYLKALVSGP